MCIHMKTLTVRDQTCGLVQIHIIVWTNKFIDRIDLYRCPASCFDTAAGHFWRLRKMQWPKPWQGARPDE